MAAVIVALALTPIVLLGGLLLVPVTLLLLSVLPIVAVAGLIVLIAHANEAGNVLPIVPMPRAGVYSA